MQAILTLGSKYVNRTYFGILVISYIEIQRPCCIGTWTLRVKPGVSSVRRASRLRPRMHPGLGAWECCANVVGMQVLPRGSNVVFFA